MNRFGASPSPSHNSEAPLLMSDVPDGKQPSKSRRYGAPKNWRTTFLATLADTSNISAAAEGALSHDSISQADLSAGRFDGARVAIGVVDWQTLERHVLYRGAIGQVEEQDGKFSAELVSRKAELQRDPVPRTSPTCRAEFCGPGCGLSPSRFTIETQITTSDIDANRVTVDGVLAPGAYLSGQLRWIDGPLTGMTSEIADISGSQLTLAVPVDQPVPAGARVALRQGCDRTIATCASRFNNAENFRGEPFLPGNDLIARYPSPAT